MLYRTPARILAAGIVAVSLALGALLSSNAPGLAATPTATATPFASASATRDNLLTLAKTATFTTNNLAGFGVFAVWTPAYPGVSLDGYGILATGSNISIYTSSLYPKQSREPFAIAFAVKDASGACAAGGITGTSAGLTTFKALPLPAAAPCSGASALEALRLDQPLVTPTATPAKTASATAPASPATTTAPTTVAAPQPPKTGTSLAENSAPGLPLIVPGILLLLGGTLALALRRR